MIVKYVENNRNNHNQNGHRLPLFSRFRFHKLIAQLPVMDNQEWKAWLFKIAALCAFHGLSSSIYREKFKVPVIVDMRSNQKSLYKAVTHLSIMIGGRWKIYSQRFLEAVGKMLASCFWCMLNKCIIFNFDYVIKGIEPEDSKFV